MNKKYNNAIFINDRFDKIMRSIQSFCVYSAWILIKLIFYFLLILCVVTLGILIPLGQVPYGLSIVESVFNILPLFSIFISFFMLCISIWVSAFIIRIKFIRQFLFNISRKYLKSFNIIR
jgi:hypothetical protein